MSIEGLWLIPYFLVLARITWTSKDWVEVVQYSAMLCTYTLMVRYL